MCVELAVGTTAIIKDKHNGHIGSEFLDQISEA